MTSGGLIKKTFSNLNNLVFLFKTDQGVRDASRVLILGTAIIVLIFHAGRQFILAPMEKKLQRLNVGVQEARATASGLPGTTATAPVLGQMQRKKIMLQKKIKLIETELDFRRRHWQAYGSAAGFNRVIFTTDRNAPFHFDKKLVSMSMAESRSAGPFTLYPTQLTGRATYKNFLSYLIFLEAKPEIGNIDSMTLTRTPLGRVDFSLTLIRNKLKDRRDKG